MMSCNVLCNHVMFCGWYIPRSHLDPPLLALPQWVVTPMYCIIDFLDPWPPSAVPPSHGNYRGTCPAIGYLPMYLTQTNTLLAPPLHKIYQVLSYLLPPSTKASLFVPIVPTPPLDSIPLLVNCRWRVTEFVPSTWTKVMLSTTSHTPRRSSPSIPLSPQQPAYIASSPTRTNTYLRLGAPDWVLPVQQTLHSGGNMGEVGTFTFNKWVKIEALCVAKVWKIPPNYLNSANYVKYVKA